MVSGWVPLCLRAILWVSRWYGGGGGYVVVALYSASSVLSSTAVVPSNGVILEEMPSGGAFVDELYFVLDHVCRRSIATCAPPTIVSMLRHVASVIACGLGNALFAVFARLHLVSMSVGDVRVTETRAPFDKDYQVIEAAAMSTVRGMRVDESVVAAGKRNVEGLLRNVAKLPSAASGMTSGLGAIIGDLKSRTRGASATVSSTSHGETTSGQRYGDQSRHTTPGEYVDLSAAERKLGPTGRMTCALNTVTMAVTYGRQLVRGVRSRVIVRETSHVAFMSDTEVDHIFDKGVGLLKAAVEKSLAAQQKLLMVPALGQVVDAIMAGLEANRVLHMTRGWYRGTHADTRRECLEDIDASMRELYNALLPECWDTVIVTVATALAERIEVAVLASGKTFDVVVARELMSFIEEMADLLSAIDGNTTVRFSVFARLEALAGALACRTEAAVMEWAHTCTREAEAHGQHKMATVTPEFLVHVWTRHHVS